MTVSIDIEAARRPDALSLPCDSLREAGGQPG
jgi:HlyD family secretion protein